MSSSHKNRCIQPFPLCTIVTFVMFNLRNGMKWEQLSCLVDTKINHFCYNTTQAKVQKFLTCFFQNVIFHKLIVCFVLKEFKGFFLCTKLKRKESKHYLLSKVRCLDIKENVILGLLFSWKFLHGPLDPDPSLYFK